MGIVQADCEEASNCQRMWKLRLEQPCSSSRLWRKAWTGQGRGGLRDNPTEAWTCGVIEIKVRGSPCHWRGGWHECRLWFAWSAFLKLSALFGEKDGRTVETGDEGTLYLFDEASLCQWVIWAPLSLCRVTWWHTLIFFIFLPRTHTHILLINKLSFIVPCALSTELTTGCWLRDTACVSLCVRPRMRLQPSNKVHNWEYWWEFND